MHTTHCVSYLMLFPVNMAALLWCVLLRIIVMHTTFKLHTQKLLLLNRAAPL